MLKELALADLEHELRNTRVTLERVPADKLDYRPHEKSWTAGGIGTHLARLPFWGSATIRGSEFDLATLPPPGAPLASLQEILALFDETAAELREAMAECTEESLTQPWTLRKGEHVIFTLPKLMAIRTNCISHMVHHRGQLTVYLRLLGAPLPPLYGPSADS